MTTVHGFGIGLRREHFDAALARTPEVDFLEVISENFAWFGGRPARVLEALQAELPILPHGVALNLGGEAPLDRDYLTALRALVDRLDPPFFSDHLAFCASEGVQHHELLPIPLREEVLERVVARVDEAQSFLGRRLAVENPTVYLEAPGAELTEAEFLRELARRTGCGLLVDVNNAYVNERNHGRSARAFLAALPHEAVLQLHLAGHDATGPLVVDTHAGPVADEVLALWAELPAKLHEVPTLLEWDHQLPSLDALVAEVRRLQGARAAHRRAA